MSADTAPAAMPGEEIRRIIEDALCEPNTVEFAVASLEALFAPILAEKEREIAWLTADRDNSNSLLDACRHERNVLQRICAERADALDKAEARALAAEAALAAERGIIKAANDMIMEFDLINAARGLTHHDEAANDIQTVLEKVQMAYDAAIRAQGAGNG